MSLIYKLFKLIIYSSVGASAGGCAGGAIAAFVDTVGTLPAASNHWEILQSAVFTLYTMVMFALF